MIHPREERYREIALAQYERVVPGIVGNPFIPHWPTPKQGFFLGAHQKPSSRPRRVFEALFGGAAGGGKSVALLMAGAQFAWRRGDFAAAYFRRSFKDLVNPGALLALAKEWWVPAGAEWNGTLSQFRFPSGARIVMGHMQQPEAHLDHQGAAYHLTAWDELSQHPTDVQYRYVGLSRVRRAEGCDIPLRTLSTSNPGNSGHQWVKNRFVGGLDPTSGKLVRAEHLYVPARLDDNPYLDRASYVEGLLDLHPTTRDQLLRGDWEARDPGDYFRVEWFGGFLDPVADAVPSRDKVSVRWWDLAASTDENAARTASCKMARFRGGARAIEHAFAFRATPGRRDARILSTAQLDGHATYVGIEIEPGSGGVAQFDSLARQLRARGFKVVGARPQEARPDAERRVVVRQPSTLSGKMGRCDPVASCLQRGHERRAECPDPGEDAPWWGADLDAYGAIRGLQQQGDGLRIYAGPWTQAYLDEVEGFPAGLVDLADATSGAYAFLEAHRFGDREPPRAPDEREVVEVANLAPDERPDPVESGRTSSGLWRP